MTPHEAVVSLKKKPLQTKHHNILEPQHKDQQEMAMVITKQQSSNQITNLKSRNTCFDCINGERHVATARCTASEGVFNTSNNFSTTA